MCLLGVSIGPAVVGLICSHRRTEKHALTAVCKRPQENNAAGTIDRGIAESAEVTVGDISEGRKRRAIAGENGLREVLSET